MVDKIIRVCEICGIRLGRDYALTLCAKCATAPAYYKLVAEMKSRGIKIKEKLS